MKGYFSRFLAIMACAALILVVFTSAHAQDIRIGALYPLSGPMALLGTHDMNGVELATDIINERGGIQGKKIKLIKGDAPTPEAARSEAERLINVENLNVIMGTYSSSLSFVASSVAEKHHRIFWETGAIADNITQRNFKYVFRTCSKASNFGNAAADFIVEVLAKDLRIPVKDLKVCIMHEDSLYGTSVMAAASKRLKESGVKLQAMESYSKSVTDLSPLLMKFKALKPDIVLADLLRKRCHPLGAPDAGDEPEISRPWSDLEAAMEYPTCQGPRPRFGRRIQRRLSSGQKPQGP